MKGRLHTDDFMQPIDQRKDGLRTERPLSHVFLLDAPILYPTLSVTDDAVNISPALEDERDIVQNAIDMADGLDFALPKAAIPSAVEVVAPKIPSTVEAAVQAVIAHGGLAFMWMRPLMQAVDEFAPEAEVYMGLQWNEKTVRALGLQEEVAL